MLKTNLIPVDHELTILITETLNTGNYFRSIVVPRKAPASSNRISNRHQQKGMEGAKSSAI